ncbi:hypothetical protein [Gelidibacter algens]|nr:hypothetical protein [Gelidibacter algens]
MKNTKILALLTIMALSISSCIIDDDAQVFSEGPHVLLFPSSQVTGFFLNDNSDDYTFTVPLKITGGDGFPLDAELNATFEVDASSTAEQGVDFDLTNSSGSVIIEAGSTFANLPIVVHSGALDPDNPTTVVLNITGGTSTSSNEIVASGNKGKITITLQATCSSDLEGVYQLAVTSSSGGSNFHPMEVITEIEEGTYLTTQSGTWNAGVLNGGVREGFIFKEVCGKLIIEQQYLAGIYSNLLEGITVLGTVDPETGDLQMVYTIGFDDNTTFNTYTATYTKL